MTFYQKDSRDYNTIADTAFGTVAGNTTSAPGWLDQSPGTTRVFSNLLRCNIETGHTGGFALDNAYATTYTASDSKVQFEWAYTNVTDSLIVYHRWQLFGGNTAGIGWQFNFPTGVYNVFGNTGTPGTGGTGTQNRISDYSGLNLTTGKTYRFTSDIQGDLLTITIFNVTDNTPHLFNAGTATLTKDLSTTGYTATSAYPGTIHLQSYNGGYGVNLKNYQYFDTTDSGPLGIAAPIGRKTTATTAQLTITPTGGTGPYTMTVKDGGGNHFTGSPATIATANTPTVFSKTGLSPLNHYVANIVLTDSAAGTYGTGQNYTTRQAGIPTSFHAFFIGDSITIGGGGPTEFNATGGTPGQQCVDYVKSWLALDTGQYSFATKAQNGYSSAQIAALITDQIVPLINQTGGTSDAGTLTAQANAVFIRLGKNDSSNTPAGTASSVQSIITAIKAQCPTVKHIVVLPITGYSGSGAEGPIASTDRQFMTNIAFRGLENLTDACKVITPSMLDFYWPVWDGGAKLDSGDVHPNDLGKSMLAIQEATTYLNQGLLQEWTYTAAQGGGGGTTVTLNVTITLNGSNQPVLTWVADPLATSYRVYRGTSPNNMAYVATVPSGTLTYTDTTTGLSGNEYFTTLAVH